MTSNHRDSDRIHFKLEAAFVQIYLGDNLAIFRRWPIKKHSSDKKTKQQTETNRFTALIIFRDYSRIKLKLLLS